jgi:hypothetical protein
MKLDEIASATVPALLAAIEDDAIEWQMIDHGAGPEQEAVSVGNAALFRLLEGYAPEDHAAILHAARTGKLETRAKLIVVLREPDPWPDLIAMLDDPEPTIRIAARERLYFLLEQLVGYPMYGSEPRPLDPEILRRARPACRAVLAGVLDGDSWAVHKAGELLQRWSAPWDRTTKRRLFADTASASPELVAPLRGRLNDSDPYDVEAVRAALVWFENPPPPEW